VPATCAAVVGSRGVPEACLCVVDSGAGLIGEEEERLAAYIATLAGAALENAFGFAASEAQSRSLLAATLESTADGILVVDSAGGIVSFNRRFADMWRIPIEVLDRRRDEAALHWASDQLADPEGFVARVQEIYAEPEGSSHDVIEFNDRRVFERYSQPQRVSGAAMARVWSFHDLTRQKRSERELERLANHDGLTGLLNRRRFEHELKCSIAELGRNARSVALLLLDVDNFKYINDTLRHGAGDELIKGVAALLGGRLRETDVIARLGGDEFAILLRDTDQTNANRVGVDLLGSIRAHRFTVDSQRISMTASIGATILEDPSLEVSQALADADLAMYEVKRHGRDGITVSAPDRALEAREAARPDPGDRSLGRRPRDPGVRQMAGRWGWAGATARHGGRWRLLRSRAVRQGRLLTNAGQPTCPPRRSLPLPDWRRISRSRPSRRRRGSAGRPTSATSGGRSSRALRRAYGP